MKGNTWALFLLLTQVKVWVGFLIWFSSFRYLEFREALWKYPAYTFWISSSCLSSEQLGSFNSKWLSGGEPFVVGKFEYSMSFPFQAEIVLTAQGLVQVCFLFLLLVRSLKTQKDVTHFLCKWKNYWSTLKNSGAREHLIYFFL